MEQGDLLRKGPPDGLQDAPGQRRSREQQLLDQVCAWIELHLHEDLGWDRLVRVSGLSHTDLQHLFERHLKTTPMTYIRTRRQAASGSKSV